MTSRLQPPILINKKTETDHSGANPGLATVSVADPVLVAAPVLSATGVIVSHTALGNDPGRDPFLKSGT